MTTIVKVLAVFFSHQERSNPGNGSPARLEVVDERFEHHAEGVGDPVENEVAGEAGQADDPAPAPVGRAWEVVHLKTGGQVSG